MTNAKIRRKRSKKQEEKIAQEMGGQVVPGSGAIAGMKSDVVAERLGFRVEDKYTDNKSYSMTRNVIDKIRREALSSGENWLLQVDLHGGGPTRRLAVLDYEVFLTLMEELHDFQTSATDGTGSESD